MNRERLRPSYWRGAGDWAGWRAHLLFRRLGHGAAARARDVPYRAPSRGRFAGGSYGIAFRFSGAESLLRPASGAFAVPLMRRQGVALVRGAAAGGAERRRKGWLWRSPSTRQRRPLGLWCRRHVRGRCGLEGQRC